MQERLRLLYFEHFEVAARKDANSEPAERSLNPIGHSLGTQYRQLTTEPPPIDILKNTRQNGEYPACASTSSSIGASSSLRLSNLRWMASFTFRYGTTMDFDTSSTELH